MRQRFRPLRARSMARRAGDEPAFTLRARERRLLGWIVAIGLVVGIAVVVGVLGGDGGDAPAPPGGSSSADASAPLAIAFGTRFDSATGEVAADARIDRFVAADDFAYSVRPGGTVPTTIFVEVERIGGGTAEIVQEAATEGEQQVTAGRPAIAFTVPAAALLEAFGPGDYRMRIFVDPAADPLAEGTFTLLAEVPPPSATASASP